MTSLLYLYGVGMHPLEPPCAVDGVGPGPGEMRAVAHREVAALVGVVDPPGPPSTARNLAAHERMADAAAALQTFLPARFGTVMADEQSLRTGLLDSRYEELRRGLARLEGCVEVRLTVRHDSDALLREALIRSPSLARLRQRVAGRPAAATYYDRIALGEAARNEALDVQHRDLDALHRVVEPVVRAVRLLSDPDGETIRLAYLVETGELERFEAGLEGFGAARAGRLAMELVGPLAAWDFTDADGTPPATRSARRPYRALARAGER